MSIKLKAKLKNLEEQEIKTLLINIKGVLDPTKSYTVYFSDNKPSRSNRANNYYWGVCLIKLAEATGHDSEELHEFFKEKFALRTKFSIAGELVEYSKSTAVMDTREFYIYVEKIRQWALNKLKLFIPEPGQLSDEDYINAIEHN